MLFIAAISSEAEDLCLPLDFYLDWRISVES